MDNPLKEKIVSEANHLVDYSVHIRRDIHAHPELGLKEFRTSDLVANELGKLGCEVIRGVGQTGVVGLFSGNRPGPTILVRFDMDALPIQEENQCDYRSTVKGVMHACGHDGHVAIGLTTARIISTLTNDIGGTVKFIFQPAEEGMGGAIKMIEDGILENPKPDISLSVHVWNDKPVGWAAISEGPVMAAADFFTIHITGKGGHGAMPHQAVDPLLAGAQLITALQSIISRNISPLQSGVVSVTQFLAGDAPNVIPQTAVIKGTIRTFEPEVRDLVIKRMEQIIQGVCSGMGCTTEFDVQKLTMPVINQSDLARRVHAIGNQVLPDLHIERDFRTMGSEDMSFIMDKVPGVYILIGSANPGEGKNFPHHHPRFDFDEKVLPVGSILMSSVICDLLKFE